MKRICVVSFWSCLVSGVTVSSWWESMWEMWPTSVAIPVEVTRKKPEPRVTNVTRGSGFFLVTSTGMATEVGHISHMLSHQEETVTPLTKQLQKLTTQILFISGSAVVVSIVINASRGYAFK